MGITKYIAILCGFKHDSFAACKLIKKFKKKIICNLSWYLISIWLSLVMSPFDKNNKEISVRSNPFNIFYLFVLPLQVFLLDLVIIIYINYHSYKFIFLSLVKKRIKLECIIWQRQSVLAQCDTNQIHLSKNHT